MQNLCQWFVILHMHRLASAFRSGFCCAVRPRISSSIFLARRALSQELSSETLAADVIPEPDPVDEFEQESIEEGDETPRSYRAFLEKIGFQYRFASPQNWLGQRVVKRLRHVVLHVDSFLSALPHEPLL